MPLPAALLALREPEDEPVGPPSGNFYQRHLLPDRPPEDTAIAAAMRQADYARLGEEIDAAIAALGEWREYHSLEFGVLNRVGDDRSRFYLADLANVLAALRRSMTPEASAISRPTAVALSQYMGRRS